MEEEFDHQLEPPEDIPAGAFSGYSSNSSNSDSPSDEDSEAQEKLLSGESEPSERERILQDFYRLANGRADSSLVQTALFGKLLLEDSARLIEVIQATALRLEEVKLPYVGEPALDGPKGGEFAGASSNAAVEAFLAKLLEAYKAETEAVSAKYQAEAEAFFAKGWGKLAWSNMFAIFLLGFAAAITAMVLVWILHC
jgi:hypothetical protein